MEWTVFLPPTPQKRKRQQPYNKKPFEVTLNCLLPVGQNAGQKERPSLHSHRCKCLLGSSEAVGDGQNQAHNKHLLWHCFTGEVLKQKKRYYLFYLGHVAR